MRFPSLLAALIVAVPAFAQNAPPAPLSQLYIAQSSQATEEVHIGARMIGGKWYPAAGIAGPARIAITYGQPHVRGRAIIGALVPFDSVWRLGANLATTLHTDADITLGGTFIPRGEYTLYAWPTKTGWQLIVNKQLNQWGTDYDASQDLARIPLRVKTRTEPLESLSIYLVPAVDAQGAAPTMPHGQLTIIWDRTELSADWKVGR